jgi:hypothetical protein
MWHVTCDMWLLTWDYYMWHVTIVTCDPWYVTMDMWFVTSDMWPVTMDMWFVTSDMWHVTMDMWFVTCDLSHITSLDLEPPSSLIKMLRTLRARICHTKCWPTPPMLTNAQHTKNAFMLLSWLIAFFESHFLGSSNLHSELDWMMTLVCSVYYY